MIKTCIICNKDFKAKRKDQICCSADCSAKRQRDINAEFRKRHPEKIQEWKEKTKINKIKKLEKLKPSKRNVIAAADDPKWIKDYAKADRLTQISMLAIALTDLNIQLMTYGKLSNFWDTDQYIKWELQVFKAKRKEHEYVKAKDSSKNKYKATGKN